MKPILSLVSNIETNDPSETIGTFWAISTQIKTMVTCRINAYRALASPSLIALSSKDPIITAFQAFRFLKFG